MLGKLTGAEEEWVFAWPENAGSAPGGQIVACDAAVKGKHCGAALESILEPCGLCFDPMAPAVSQIHPTDHL